MHCKLLEKHIHINVLGKYQSCCVSSDRFNVESIHTHTPQDWLNSDKVRSSIELLKQNQWPEQCGYCKSREEHGLNSDRLAFDHLGEGVEFLDLRFSNSCNLKCISCNPKCSSSIYDEFLQMQEQKIIPIIPEIEKVKNWVSDEQIDNLLTLPLKTVKFAGGEPMMIKYIPDALEKLDKDVTIRMVSNMTIFNPKIFNSLKKFKTVNIAASVDAIGDKIEYIRYGSKWKDIQENIFRYSEVAKVNLTVCVSVLNVLYLDEIQEFADKHNLKVWYDLLEVPLWLNIKNAPDSIKKIVGDRFNAWNSIGSPSQMEIFKKNINILDNFRKVSIKNYLPEVADAYGM